MTIDELRELIRVQLPPLGESARIVRLYVAPDVWARLTAEVPRTEEPAAFYWDVIVDRHMRPGQILPVDADGRPVLGKPRPATALVNREDSK